jgi:hypothetical protein
VKKVLTDEQKTRATIKKLKEAALPTPTKKPETVWSIMFASSKKKGESASTAKESTAAAAQKYKTLSPAELEVRAHRRIILKYTNLLSLDLQPSSQSE